MKHRNNAGINSLTFVPSFFLICAFFHLFVLSYWCFHFCFFFLISDTFVLREICHEKSELLLLPNINPSLNGGKLSLYSEFYTLFPRDKGDDIKFWPLSSAPVTLGSITISALCCMLKLCSPTCSFINRSNSNEGFLYSLMNRPRIYCMEKQFAKL